MIDTVIANYWDSEFPEIQPRGVALDLSSSRIVDIVGPRRAGKTYLMLSAAQQIADTVGKKATIYVNFENRRLLPLREQYFNDLIAFIHQEKLLQTCQTVYLFLDEIQRIPKWEQFIRGIYDEYKGKLKMVVSGSNANLLSREYGKLLTGRHETVTVLPLSFSEFLTFKHNSADNRQSEANAARLRKSKTEFIRFGGFPEMVLENNASKKEEHLNQLFSDILARDVAARESPKKVHLLEEFAYYLASNLGTLVSFNKMARYFASRGEKISVPTLQRYFSLMENAFLFFDLTIFARSVKDQLQYPRKVYCVDTGLANLVGFKFNEDRGRFLENIVAVELKRRFASTPTVRFHYWKDPSGREVDFVVKRGINVVELIQVCSDVSDEKTRQREVRSLLAASKDLSCRTLSIITESYEGKETVERKTISLIPIWKWLLKNE